MNPITLDAIKLLLDMQSLNCVSEETKKDCGIMIEKLLRWMHSDIDAVIAKTSKFLN